jgi:ABC-type amino acid transport substrate-binding protein
MERIAIDGVAFGRLAGWLLALVLIHGAAWAADPSELRLGSDRWPPFTDADGQTRLAIDLVHEALQRVGVAAGTTIVEWQAVVAGLRQGDLDGSAAMWRSADREEFLLFSEPYLENRLVLVGRKGRDVSANTLAELAGRRVAVVAQYAYGEDVDGAVGPQFVEGRSDQDNLQKLLAGEVAYMLVDELLIRYLLEYRGDEAGGVLEIGTTPLVRRTLHFALRRDHPRSKEIVDAFNDQVKKMLADGTYNEILQLDWIRADVDGDGRLELVPRESRAGKTPPETGYSILSAVSSDHPISATDNRYWINGRVYDDWDSVPEEYKAPPPTPPEPPPPALLRF